MNTLVSMGLVAGMLTSGSLMAQKKTLPDNLLKKGGPIPTEIIVPILSVGGWLTDDQMVLRPRRDAKPGTKSVVVNMKTGVQVEATAEDLAILDHENDKRVYVKTDDVFYNDGKSEVQLTATKDKEVNPTLSPDGKYVAFTRNNNLYVLDVVSKQEKALTSDGSEVILNGYASWVYMEEILGRSSHYRSFWWSPDSKHLAYFRSDDSKVPVFPIYREDGQHGYLENERYPKAGDPNPEVKVGVADVESGSTVWADFNEHDDQYFGMPYWRPDGKALWVQWLNRGQDHYGLYEVALDNGRKHLIYEEQQKTWISLDDEGSRIRFLASGKGFVLQSDQTGWNHLYLYDMSGKAVRAITSGNYTVTSLDYIDEENSTVYFTARKEKSTCFDFYSVKWTGKDAPKRLTFGDFSHSVSVSPKGSYFVTTYSNTLTPAKVALVTMKGKVLKELADSKGAEFDNYDLAKTEEIRVKSADGLFDLPANVTWPLHMDPNKRYPVLISIYGGPSAGTVRQGFALSTPQQWLAKEGVIQISMDHRASGQFGKAGVNYMYRDLGDWELKDYATIVQYLINKGYADSAKVCITGFSYGGYMTCLALTKYADVFKFGMAGGSVTDWRLYDSHYTERFMDQPSENPEGYKTSAVTTFVGNYKGVLQIVHGTADDNVHLQNSLQLVRALQDKKAYFEMMFYPGGRHGWPGMQALHFQNEKTRFIYKYLLEKPVPDGLLK